MTGHLLGATGGCEAAFLWLMLNPATRSGLSAAACLERRSPIRRCRPSTWWRRAPASTGRGRLAMLSNSFGFGGSNVALAAGARREAMACPYTVADLLPHAPPMILLDEVLDWSDERHPRWRLHPRR